MHTAEGKSNFTVWLLVVLVVICSKQGDISKIPTNMKKGWFAAANSHSVLEWNLVNLLENTLVNLGDKKFIF